MAAPTIRCGFPPGGCFFVSGDYRIKTAGSECGEFLRRAIAPARAAALRTMRLLTNSGLR
jgi:hypothetical protein